MQRDVQFGVQFSFYFNRSEAKRDETKRENVVADVENICGTLDQDQGLAYILFFPVNRACLRLSFNVCVCVCLQQTKYLKTVEGCSTNHQRKAEAEAEAAASASGASELSSCSVQGEENKTKIVDGKIKVRVSRSTVDGRRVPAALLLFCLVFGGATAQAREKGRETERE